MTGVPFGLLMGRWAAKCERDVRHSHGDLPADEVAVARRAAAGGPVPDDPQVRSAALRLANQQLAQFGGRTRMLRIAVLALVFGGSVVGVLNGSLWAWLPATALGVVLFSQWYLPRRIRRRIESLSTATPPDAD
ncbi:hypothetical protein [Kribbella flavida]|uniref:hypothetical protein n=1 Tax=Kribbella flavida TaxID=182640 RepID=UPI00019BD149|nr:hypothetical protein [Kribbella flavida]